MSDYDDDAGMDDDGREDSFNQPVDDDLDDADPDDFDEMKDEDDSAGGPSSFTTSSSSHSIAAAALDPIAERKEYEALDEAGLRADMDRLIADVAAVIDVNKDKAALLLRTQKYTSPSHAAHR